MDKNIMISASLLMRMIGLLEYWDISEYDETIRQDHNIVMMILMKKKQSMELRDTYVKIIHAENEYDRDEARMRYLQQKRLMNEL